MATLTLTIPDELLEDLRAKADSEGGRSVSSVIREACTEKLERERNQAQSQAEEVVEA